VLKLIKTWIESDQASSSASDRASTQASIQTPAQAATTASVTPSLAPAPLQRVIQGSPRDLAIHHARLLLKYIGEGREPGPCLILVDDLRAFYREMCHELRLRERPWNHVGAAFAEITRLPGRPLKTYSKWINHRGETKRLRVYMVTLT
jgi:hypothetical protein